MPPSTAFALTATGPEPVPLPVELLTRSVPAATVVPPLYELPAERARVKIPEPLLVNPPVLFNWPLNVVELLLPPVTRLEESETLPPEAPPPERDPIVSLAPLTVIPTPAVLPRLMAARSPIAVPPSS